MLEVTATILVVDDDPVNRDLLCRRLVRVGYVAPQAASGQEALDMIAETPDDLVLLDVEMPHMSGLSVLHTIRRDRTRRRGCRCSWLRRATRATTSSRRSTSGPTTTSPSRSTSRWPSRASAPTCRAGSRGAAAGQARNGYALAAGLSSTGCGTGSRRPTRLYFSTRWKAILGHEDDEIGNRPEEWFDRVHPEDAARVQRDIERTWRARRRTSKANTASGTSPAPSAGC